MNPRFSGDEYEESRSEYSLWSCIKRALRKKKCTCHLNNLGKVFLRSFYHFSFLFFSLFLYFSHSTPTLLNLILVHLVICNLFFGNKWRLQYLVRISVISENILFITAFRTFISHIMEQERANWLFDTFLHYLLYLLYVVNNVFCD